MGLTCNGLHRPLRLQLAADGRIDADAAVLATGNRPPAPPCRCRLSHRYIRDPWLPGALYRVGDGSPVVVIGSGLTMLDVAISLTGAHPDLSCTRYRGTRCFRVSIDVRPAVPSSRLYSRRPISARSTFPA